MNLSHAHQAGREAATQFPKLMPHDVAYVAFEYGVRNTTLLDNTHAQVIEVMAAWLFSYAAERSKNERQ